MGGCLGQGHHAEVTATKKMMTPRQLAQAETGRMDGKGRQNEHPPLKRERADAT